MSFDDHPVSGCNGLAPPHQLNVDQVPTPQLDVDQAPPHQEDVDQVPPHQQDVEHVPPHQEHVDLVLAHQEDDDRDPHRGGYVVDGRVVGQMMVHGYQD